MELCPVWNDWNICSYGYNKLINLKVYSKRHLILLSKKADGFRSATYLKKKEKLSQSVQ